MKCIAFRSAARTALTAALVTLAAAATTSPAEAQNTRHGISIGNHPDVQGIRINFRDRDLQRVDGVNITLWSPHEPMSGRVRGIALGLPAGGAGDIEGVAAGVFGVGAANSIRGLAVGGLGVGAGGSLRGIAVGGIGVGAGGGGRGAVIGGIGAGIGGDFRGLAVGGIGAGIGGNFRGIGVGGVGVGVGGDARGLLVGGVGVGAGGTLRGIAIGGIGVGASELDGFAASLVGVGAGNAHALVITAGMLRIEKDGRFRGVSVNAVGSLIKGSQRGVVIGLVNYARSVDRGMQIGLINIIDENRSHRVLPILNWRD